MLVILLLNNNIYCFVDKYKMSSIIFLTKRYGFLLIGCPLLEKTLTSANHEFYNRLICRNLSTTQGMRNEIDKSSKNSYLVKRDFEDIEKRDKNTYLLVLQNYVKYNTTRHGHVQFIETALKYLNKFGVQHDIEVYKELFNIIPKRKYAPTNRYQAMFLHFPKEQEVGCEILRYMEDNKVCPDEELGQVILQIFGRESGVARRYRRQLYWASKMRHLNPWYIQRPVPQDIKILSNLAIRKLASVDEQSEVVQYLTKDDVECNEDTWVISSMSLTQKDLLKRQPLNKAVFVEGPFQVWLVDRTVDYFILRGDPRPRKIKLVDQFDMSDFDIEFWNKKPVPRPETVHEQSDGVYFAMCATGTSSKASLLSWIRFLEKENPILKYVPVVFKLQSSTSQTGSVESGEQETEEISNAFKNEKHQHHLEQHEDAAQKLQK